MHAQFLKSAFIVSGITVSGMLASASSAQALSLTSTFAGGNGFAGNMFDVRTFDKGLKITGLDLHFRTQGEAKIDIYTRSGSFVGFETKASGWTKVASGIGLSQGSGVSSLLDISDFSLAANSVTGFYVVRTNYNARNDDLLYTNGNNIFANGDLQLEAGVGCSDTMFDCTFSPRTWNGTIHYEYDAKAVPTPAAVLPVIMGMFGSAFKRKRHEEDVN